MSILFILLFIFIIWPIIRVSWVIHKARKQARTIYEQRFGRQEGSSQTERKAGWSKPEQTRAKVFKRTDGDYVQFEDIEVTTQTTTQTDADGSTSQHTTTTVDHQIIDIDWEDIK